MDLAKEAEDRILERIKIKPPNKQPAKFRWILQSLFFIFVGILSIFIILDP